MPIGWILTVGDNELLTELVGEHRIRYLQWLKDDLKAAAYADRLITLAHWKLGIALDRIRLMPEA